MTQLTTRVQAAANLVQPDPYRPRLTVTALADIRRFEQTPLAERRLPDSTYELLRLARDRAPEAPALHYFTSGDELAKSVTITHAQMFGRITQTANLLHSLGLGAGDVIGVLMPVTPESQYAIWGSEATGIACPVNWMLEPEIIAALLRNAGAKAVIAYGPDPDIEAWNKAMLVRRELPGVQHWIKAGGGKASEPGIVDLDAALERFDGDSLDSQRVFSPADTASMFHTGGTTGTPKLALHTHGNEVAMAWISAMQIDVQPEDVRVCGVPMFHVTGVLTNCLMPLARGASVVMLTSSGWRDPSVIRNLWQIVEHFGVTALGMVPSVVNMALNIPVGDADISSLKAASCGTAPLSVAVAEAFERLTGALIFEGYGLTEGTALSATNPRYGQRRIGSIGLPMAYQEMKVVKVADGRIQRDCAPGEPGIVVVRGPNIFAGYLNPEQNKGIWFDGGWFNTGDLGYADEDGYFWLTGRAKDLIIRGGNNIDPRMIEEALYRHPEVFDAAAVGLPDAHAGELPVAYVALKPGSTYPLGRIKHYAYEVIPERAAVPKQFYLVDAIPKTAVGKIQKNALRSDAVLRAQRQMLAEVNAQSPVPLVDIRIDDRGDQGLLSTLVLPSALSAEEREAAVASIDKAFTTLTIKYAVVYE
ncbi:acyl-CoA synthetase [Cupriavidus sp. IK-TO18]|uniref:acyl-CoA synthetase n=1 Tax=Cupriavidus sp. IK-TO18 TaxID=2782182 RepID=UPI0018971F6A|nr:acyl-CoA synthetase [Cupriavidus sp. IK-TO18]MBF6987556.1 acyl-CoA synthetase [Cupriavidus sp. IK-TO18]